jgi:hypothetical protein
MINLLPKGTMPSKRLLENRLTAHFATLRSSSLVALKGRAGSWQIYAAVTGSALAMATNVSAGIIYSGPENIKTRTIPNVASSTGGFTFASKTVGIKAGEDFRIKASQISTHRTKTGRASLIGGGLVGFLHTGGKNSVKMLASGAKISAGAGNFSFAAGPSYSHVAFEQHAAGGGKFTSGWPVGQIGFAGFDFGVSPGVNDYGWIELEYLEGSDGLADEIEVLGVAYDNTGSVIKAGELPGTPEPSTGALALLAAGAAGIEALRRRRKAAV